MSRKSKRCQQREPRAASGGNPDVLRTLAAAYAEAGEFPNAVRTAQRALQIAGDEGNTVLAGILSGEIKIYGAGHSFEQLR